MRSKKLAQTATEYLIIIGVVLIIAVVVVSLLGGIPGIGGSSNVRTNDAYLRTLDVGVSDHRFSNVSEEVNVTFINNLANSVTLTAVTVDGSSCTLTGPTLRVGQSNTYVCDLSGDADVEISAGSDYDFDLSITYTEGGASYTLSGNDIALQGRAAT